MKGSALRLVFVCLCLALPVSAQEWIPFALGKSGLLIDLPFTPVSVSEKGSPGQFGHVQTWRAESKTLRVELTSEYVEREDDPGAYLRRLSQAVRAQHPEAKVRTSLASVVARPDPLDASQLSWTSQGKTTTYFYVRSGAHQGWLIELRGVENPGLCKRVLDSTRYDPDEMRARTEKGCPPLTNYDLGTEQTRLSLDLPTQPKTNGHNGWLSQAGSVNISIAYNPEGSAIPSYESIGAGHRQAGYRALGYYHPGFHPEHAQEARAAVWKLQKENQPRVVLIIL